MNVETDLGVTDTQLKDEIRQLTRSTLERFVADLWEYRGWNTEADVLAFDGDTLIEAVRIAPYEEHIRVRIVRPRGKRVTTEAVDRFADIVDEERKESDIDKALLVTGDEFSAEARTLAHERGVKTIDGDGLVHALREEDTLDLIVEYLSIEVDDSTTLFSQAGSRGLEAEAAPENSDLDRWRWVFGAISVTVVGLMFAMAGGTDGLLDWVAVFLLVIGWIIIPITIGMDGRAVRRETEWSTWWPLYAFGSLIPMMGLFLGAAYLARRYAKVGISH